MRDERFNRGSRIALQHVGDRGILRLRVQIDPHHDRALGEEVAESHRELVHSGTDHDGNVGLVHLRHGFVLAEPARDAEIEFAARENTARRRGTHGDRTERVREFPKRSARTREPCTAAGEQDGAFRRRQNSGDLCDLGG